MAQTTKNKTKTLKAKAKRPSTKPKKKSILQMPYVRPALFIAIFAVIGTIWIVVSHAATVTGPFAQTCSNPASGLIDTKATKTTRCALTVIRALGKGGNVAIGQHLDTVNFHTRKPLIKLLAETYNGVPAATPAVIGTDMGAFITYLDKPNNGGRDVINTNIKSLTADAKAGRLVTMQWHARNPISGGGFKDHTGRERVAELLDVNTVPGQTWKAETDKSISILKRLADANVTVAWRPFHEANLSSFWWGKMDPVTYRALWIQMQQRFDAAGLHNIIWVYGPNDRWGTNVADPLAYTPAKYDVFGLDTYQYKTSPTEKPRVPINKADYERITATGKPFALTEVDVLNDRAASTWPPSTVTDAISTVVPNAAWASFWWTYQGTDNGASAEKQSIVDLLGHQDWWKNCLNGTCPTKRIPIPLNIHLTNSVLTWSCDNKTDSFQVRKINEVTTTDTAPGARKLTVPGATRLQIRAVRDGIASAWVNVIAL